MKNHDDHVKADYVKSPQQVVAVVYVRHHITLTQPLLTDILTIVRIHRMSGVLFSCILCD